MLWHILTARQMRIHLQRGYFSTILFNGIHLFQKSAQLSSLPSTMSGIDTVSISSEASNPIFRHQSFGHWRRQENFVICGSQQQCRHGTVLVSNTAPKGEIGPTIESAPKVAPVVCSDSKRRVEILRMESVWQLPERGRATAAPVVQPTSLNPLERGAPPEERRALEPSTGRSFPLKSRTWLDLVLWEKPDGPAIIGDGGHPSSDVTRMKNRGWARRPFHVVLNCWLADGHRLLRQGV